MVSTPGTSPQTVAQPSAPLVQLPAYVWAEPARPARRVALAVGAVLFAWLCAYAFIMPYDPDEAVYSIIARGMFDGQWPYKDLFDHKPPLVYAWYTPAGLGANIETMRIIAAGTTAASVYPLLLLARRWLDGRQISFAVGGYGMLLANPFLAVGANVEAFVLLPLLGSFAVSNAWLAGALFGVALMTKPVVIVFAPLLVLLFRASAWRVATAAVVVCAAVAAPFLPIWREFVEANVSFNADYRSQNTQLGFIAFFDVPLGVWVGALPVWLLAAASILRPLRRQLIALAVCSAVAVNLTGFAFQHYYALLAPAAAMMASVALDAGLKARGHLRVAVVDVSIAALVVCTMICSLAVFRAYQVKRTDTGLAEVLSGIDGEFYLLGDRSQIYAQANRQPQRRFFFSVPMVVNRAWGAQMRQELIECPPEALLALNVGLFEVDWDDELRSQYATERDFGGGVLLTQPLAPCDR